VNSAANAAAVRRCFQREQSAFEWRGSAHLNSQGVFGLNGLNLSAAASNATQGSVVTSAGRTCTLTVARGCCWFRRQRLPRHQNSKTGRSYVEKGAFRRAFFISGKKPFPCALLYSLGCLLLRKNSSRRCHGAYLPRVLCADEPDERTLRHSHESAVSFSNILRRLVKDYARTTWASCSTPRARRFATSFSKSTRRSARPCRMNFRCRIPYVRKLCEAMHLPILEFQGFEADDVIARWRCKPRRNSSTC